LTPLEYFVKHLDMIRPVKKAETYTRSGVGSYRWPSRATRFTKGQSDNSAGRTPGRRREARYEAALGQIVTANAELSAVSLRPRRSYCNSPNADLEGEGAAARATLAIIERVTERPSHTKPS